MTAEALETGALIEQYAARLSSPDRALPLGTPRGADELLAPGRPRDGARLLEDTVNRLGTIGLQARCRMVERLVADDGITYGGDHPGRPARPWLLDPLPVVLDADEWARLERGLDQRARLLDAVFADLNGPRTLVASGVLPGGLVAAHPGFLPQAEGITLPGRRALPMTSTDLARTPDGSWTVLADRTQAPSGAGYAMANRRITARALERLHRRTPLRRLRGWFSLFAEALQQTAPPGVDDLARVVLLTPGPGSETAFDQALLSTLLGHPLAQSDDLVMRGGRLWRRTMGRLEAVDVVLRRVDADWTDSLDLLGQSRLGVPGLVAAARRGTVSVVNPLRASLLENPGLLPFQDALAKALLGEELQLRVPETWWCGEPHQRAYVLGRLGGLVIKPIHRGAGESHLLGWQQTRAQLDELRDRIRAEPWAWTAQEPLVKSTAPVVTRLGLEPRGLMLRTFGVAVDDGYHFLPGGLARVAPSVDSFNVTNTAGAAAKDVWVLDTEDAAPSRIDLDTLTRARVLPADAQMPGLTPRAADNLYWLGRYTERAELGARLAMVADNLVEDHHRRPGTPGHTAMQVALHALTAHLSTRAGVPAVDADALLAEPLPFLEALLIDDTRGGVASNVTRARTAAQHAREILSMDTPSVLSRLDRVLEEARAEESVPVQLVASRILDSLLALAGLSNESLVRDEVWAFLQAGRRIERAQSIPRLLRTTLTPRRAPVVEAQVVESVLRVADSLITYRRRMSAGVGHPHPVVAALTLLVDEPANPRSLAFQLDSLREALAHAPHVRIDEKLTELRRRVRQADLAALAAGDREELVAELRAWEDALRGLSDEIEAVHFVAQAPQSSFVVAELTGGGA
ncbi:MAG: circularly permuted type 2 ATP-grasp protein [Propioniciclava sp.]|uniref:circularly permuted type 2 ATP-grasp protein n=1 Tax=Propioniciclava sp. TaxID=2038686 RepID=UPI0039E585EC